MEGAEKRKMSTCQFLHLFAQMTLVLDTGEEPSSNPTASVQLDNAENNSWVHDVFPERKLQPEGH